MIIFDLFSCGNIMYTRVFDKHCQNLKVFTITLSLTRTCQHLETHYAHFHYSHVIMMTIDEVESIALERRNKGIIKQNNAVERMSYPIFSSQISNRSPVITRLP